MVEPTTDYINPTDHKFFDMDGKKIKGRPIAFDRKSVTRDFRDADGILVISTRYESMCPFCCLRIEFKAGLKSIQCPHCKRGKDTLEFDDFLNPFRDPGQFENYMSEDPRSFTSASAQQFDNGSINASDNNVASANVNNANINNTSTTTVRDNVDVNKVHNVNEFVDPYDHDFHNVRVNDDIYEIIELEDPPNEPGATPHSEIDRIEDDRDDRDDEID